MQSGKTCSPDIEDAAEMRGRDYGYEKNFKTARPQLMAVCVKNLVLLAYGMTLGFTTILIPAVSNPKSGETLQLESSELSWISSLNLIVVPLGCALSGAVTTPLGRRRAMQMVNIPFFVAWLVFYAASSSTMLYIALGLTGLAGGLLEAPVLTYVAEVTQPHLRGLLSATSSMTIILGVFTQFLFGIFLNWRLVALVNITFTVLAIILLFFIPESPHWLVSKNRMDEARKSLQWLRGAATADKVGKELGDIQLLFSIKNAQNASNNKQESLAQSLSHYATRGFLLPYLLVSSAFFVGHFCGMTSLQTFAMKIFQLLNTPIDRYYATLILGSVQIAGSLTCVVLVHYTGKRPLTLVSLVGAALCCLVVAGYDFYLQNPSKFPEGHAVHSSHADLRFNVTATSASSVQAVASSDGNAQYAWIPLVSLMMLAGLSHIGIRLLPWILIGEVFPAKTRSGASGLSSATGYIFAFLSNKFFSAMLDTMFIRGTYSFYAFISITGAIVFYFALPETEGKNLIDIENHFSGLKKLSNEVYKSQRKPRTEPNPPYDLAPEQEITKL